MPILSFHRHLVPLLVAATTGGCTFYTSCPTDTGNGNPPGNGGGSNTGGSGGGSPPAIIEDNIPPGEWVSVMPQFESEFDCGPVYYMSSRPGHDQILAGMARDQLLVSEDGGNSWRQLASAEGSDKVANRATGFIYDPDHTDVYWEYGVYGAGVFKTVDGGETFKQQSDLLHLDSVTVDFSDPDRKTFLAHVHEAQTMKKSTDGAQTWVDISNTIPSGSKTCRQSLILDTDTYLMACGGGIDQGNPGLFKSFDGGGSWEQTFETGGGAHPLTHSDGSIYWPDEFEKGLLRSTDQGDNWERVVDRTVLSVTPVELPDGRIASVTSDAVVVSDDAGATWARVTPPTPFKPVGLTYSPVHKAFFIFDFGCGAQRVARGDEIQRFVFDYEKY